MKTNCYLTFLITFFLLAVSIQSNAQTREIPPKFKTQVEFKVNPVLLLFKLVQLEAEFVLNKNFGLATEVLAGQGGGGAGLHGKYYFNPDFGCDKFYFGAFAGGIFGERDFLGAALGFEIGHKWVDNNEKILFELTGGLGRTTEEGVIPYFKTDIGYRF